MGMGFSRVTKDISYSNKTHPPPNPPLEGEGTQYSTGRASIAQRITPHGEHSDCSNRKKKRKTMQYTARKTHGKLNNIHTAQYAALLTPYEKNYDLPSY
jgi:hypothetical protein